MFCIICSFLLVSCAPKKPVEAPTESTKIEKKEPLAKIKPAPSASEKMKKEKKDGLTPQEELQLKYEEENLEPFPG